MAGFKRIILHWTAGSNNACEQDRKCYHYLVTGDGKVINGIYKPEDNLDCSDGKYAMHTGGGNTKALGLSMCGMAGYVTGKPDSTKYPLTKVQCERFFKLIAELAKKYNLPINPQTVMTHYEFGKTHPKTTSAGKIDINYLHPYGISGEDVGNFIRSKAKWYLLNG